MWAKLEIRILQRLALKYLDRKWATNALFFWKGSSLKTIVLERPWKQEIPKTNVFSKSFVENLMAKTLIQSCRGQKTTGKEPGTSLLLNSVE